MLKLPPTSLVKTLLIGLLVAFLPLFIFSGFAQEVKEVQGVKYTEEVLVFQTPFEDKGLFSTETKMVEMRAYLRKPVDGRKQPRPLVLFSHGSQDAGVIFPIFRPQAAWNYLNRGYAVIFPIRKGFNREDAPPSEARVFVTEPTLCDYGTAESGVKSAVTDTMSTMKALRAKDYGIDFTKVILVGQSRGGFLSLALAANDFPGAIAVINFAGGWFGERCLASFNTQKFKAFGEGIKVPTLSFYGDQDRYYGEKHINENLEYLKNLPNSFNKVFQNEGHSLIRKTELWWPIVEKELDRIEGKAK